MERKNINRGYQKLIVWQDAVELYVLTWRIFQKFPYELKKLIEKLQYKQEEGDWDDSFAVGESNAVYGGKG